MRNFKVIMIVTYIIFMFLIWEYLEPIKDLVYPYLHDQYFLGLSYNEKILIFIISCGVSFILQILYLIVGFLKYKDQYRDYREINFDSGNENKFTFKNFLWICIQCYLFSYIVIQFYIFNGENVDGGFFDYLIVAFISYLVSGAILFPIKYIPLFFIKKF